MPERTSLITGIGEDAAGVPILPREQDERLNHVLAQSSSLFGGVSIYPGIGAWIDANGHLVREPNVTLVIYTDDSDDAQAKSEQLAEIVREAFNQTAVVLTVTPDVTPHFHFAAEAIPVG